MNIISGKGLRLLIGVLGGGLIISGSLSAGEKEANPRFVELRASSPINYQDYSSHIPKLISGFILKTYFIEYQYPNVSYRVVGMDIRTPDDEIYYVHLAPPKLFTNRGVAFHQGNNVIVRGPIMNIDQRPALIASMVSHQGQNIRLRTNKGIPTWNSELQIGHNQGPKFEY